MTDDSVKQPIVVLACKVFQGMFERFAKPGTIQKYIYLDYGLHRIPRKLNQAIQEALDSLQEPSLVVLGYGLCGNGLQGIRAGKHTLLHPGLDQLERLGHDLHESYRWGRLC